MLYYSLHLGTTPLDSCFLYNTLTHREREWAILLNIPQAALSYIVRYIFCVNYKQALLQPYTTVIFINKYKLYILELNIILSKQID
jgi:hypothetical protein